LTFTELKKSYLQLEQKYELTPVASSWESGKAADTTGQIRRYKRFASLEEKPQESIKRQLQNLCDEAAADQPSLGQYKKRLKDAGVETLIRETRTGKIQGISYELDSVAFAGHKLGRNYSLCGLQRLGITEQERAAHKVSHR
jgi:hypothetical protein